MLAQYGLSAARIRAGETRAEVRYTYSFGRRGRGYQCTVVGLIRQIWAYSQIQFTRCIQRASIISDGDISLLENKEILRANIIGRTFITLM